MIVPQYLTRRVNPSKSKQKKNKFSPFPIHTSLCCFKIGCIFYIDVLLHTNVHRHGFLNLTILAMVKGVANFCPNTSSSITLIFLIFLNLNCKTFFPNLHIFNLSQTSVDCKRKLVVMLCSTSCIRSHFVSCVCFDNHGQHPYDLL